MGDLINRKVIIDRETGEVLKTSNWIGYDGFNDKGYKYRQKADFIRYYFDSLPQNLSAGAFLLLIMIAELANNENVLVYRVHRKSKFSNIVYKPMLKDDIYERLRYKYGMNKFDRCWRELSKKCLKKIMYHDVYTWAINPAVISRCPQIPLWLYEEFSETLNPHLTGITIKKFQDKIDSQY